MTMPVLTAAYRRAANSVSAFTRDETGSIGIFMVFMFVLMFMFGGIAVDVMRFETRRVALQQTMDRAALAAASLTQTGDGRAIAQEWFDKTDVAGGLDMVDITPPTILAVNDAGLRRVTINSEVRSYNYFIGKFYDDGTRDITYLEGPALSEAAQGVSEIEVMLVLDITGSMADPDGSGSSKIASLREAAEDFVEIVKANDSKNGVSIGIVPYSSQVNLPKNLREQFTVSDLSVWDGVAYAGVPNINCIEVPWSTYTATSLSTSTSMRMAAVADTQSGTNNTSDYLAPSDYPPTTDPLNRVCNTLPSKPTANHLFLPTKTGGDVISRIQQLEAGGYTSIAIGMRWGVAMLDQAARPIYTAIGDATVVGRPANNDSVQTRKIIILMTDGEHVATNHIRDNYKTGLSPIWVGTDGKIAMRFWSAGGGLNDNTRPDCAGGRTYFVPHLKPNNSTSCNSDAWKSTPSWTGSGTVRQLDWSEVWRYVRLSYVARQIYGRSNVSGTGYDTVMSTFRTTFQSAGNLNTYLQRSCTAARTAGIEIYGIAFAAPAGGQTQINNCSSSPKENYYYNAADGDKLRSAFRAIATDISELRLTQ